MFICDVMSSAFAGCFPKIKASNKLSNIHVVTPTLWLCWLLAIYFVLCSRITRSKKPSNPVPLNTRNKDIGDTAASEALFFLHIGVNLKINVFFWQPISKIGPLAIVWWHFFQSFWNFFFGKPFTGVSMNGTTSTIYYYYNIINSNQTH